MRDRSVLGVYMLDLKDHNGKIDIKSMTPEELEAFLKELGEKPFRAKQIYDWLHVKLAERFEPKHPLF